MDTGADSPPTQPRSTTILGSFLRGRPRNSSQSHIHVPIVPLDGLREMSPSPPMQGPPSPNPASARRRGQGQQAQIQALVGPPSIQQQGQPGSLNQLSHMLRRRRSAGNVPSAAPTPITPAQPMPRAATNANINSNQPAGGTGTGPAHRIRLVPHLDSRRSLRFDAIARDLRAGDSPLRIGRFTDRSGLGLSAVNALSTNKIAFKSKVVSRAHAEVWVENDGPDAVKFFIRDTKSSSGTFLNHLRLSAANTESRPHQVKDGDILQLGVDYQGGAEDIYKSVKIRVELGREWQAAANAFNTTALKNLKALAIGATGTEGTSSQPKSKRKSLGGGSIPDCCICLFPVSIRQALFIAPCSHTFHYKCLRPLLEAHHPAFSCPLCRTFADLEEDVEIEIEEEEEEYEEIIPDAADDPPPPIAHDEGVLADDLADEDGDEVDEMYAAPRIRVDGGGVETEVEDNAGMSGAAMRRSRNVDEDMPPPPPPPDAEGVDMEVDGDADSGEGSGSGDVLGGATLGAKRKR
ncbi:cytoplasmic protein [Roridomyces roridus]|uniref:Cytoplasmic protein n=1 Tax=Roridomyces roridus TaxID=1738132 RepID=A0AAD7BGL7_9AGAR|nr:cytoplasmic protein [Roridomyces roridus]